MILKYFTTISHLVPLIKINTSLSFMQLMLSVVSYYTDRNQSMNSKSVIWTQCASFCDTCVIMRCSACTNTYFFYMLTTSTVNATVVSAVTRWTRIGYLNTIRTTTPLSINSWVSIDHCRRCRRRTMKSVLVLGGSWKVVRQKVSAGLEFSEFKLHIFNSKHEVSIGKYGIWSTRRWTLRKS